MRLEPGVHGRATCHIFVSDSCWPTVKADAPLFCDRASLASFIHRYLQEITGEASSESLN